MKTKIYAIVYLLAFTAFLVGVRPWWSYTASTVAWPAPNTVSPLSHPSAPHSATAAREEWRRPLEFFVGCTPP